MRTASPTFSIHSAGSRYVALATFPHGLVSARRPVSGDPCATPADAMVSLLAQPALAYALTAIVAAPPVPDDVD